jgi:four helix bundle protein
MSISPIADCGLRIADCGLRIMNAEQLKKRTKDFAHRVINLAESLPTTRTADVIARQMIRCGTSVASNYRAACRARSPAEFQAKLGIVEEEADETCFWLEFVSERGLVKRKRLEPLLDESNEILAIVVSSIRTSRRKR